MSYQTLCNSLTLNDSVFYKRISDKLEFYSYGCYDSRWDLETITEQINLESLKENIIIIDVCAAIDVQEEISKSVVDKISKIYPNKKIIITGCGITYDRDFYSKYGITLDNRQKFDLSNYPFESIKRDIFKIAHFNGAIKIQDGCFNKCAYCAIKNFRCHYTYSEEEIFKQVKASIDNGINDILLFGTEICEWHQNNKDLVDLCKDLIDHFPQIKIRLDSINPGFRRIFDLIELIKIEPRMKKDIDLSVQSCSDKILKSINRFYNVNKLFEINKRIDNSIYVAYQLITGLPGETEDIFLESLDNLKKINPSLVTVCTFSERKDTQLYNAKNAISKDVAEQRKAIIQNIFAAKEKGTYLEFAKYKPCKYKKGKIFEVDLYSLEELIKLWNLLEKNNSSKYITVFTDFKQLENQEDFALNVKLLLITFGVKVITRIKLDDYLIRQFDIINFAVETPTYLEIDFEKLETITKEEIINLANIILEYSLDNIEEVVIRLIRSKNSNLARAIIEEFNLDL